MNFDFRIIPLLLLAIALFSNGLYSQKDVAYTTLKHNKESLSNHDYHVVEVIDERSSKDYIGQVQMGLANKKKAADFEKPLQEEFLSYLHFLLPYSEEKTSLTVIVHHLWVTEKTTFSKEKGFMNISMSFKPDNDETYGPFQHDIERGGLDVTKKHESRIREGIVECLEKFFFSLKDNSLLVKQSSEQLSFDGGFPQELKAGFYKEYMGLVTNEPVTSEPIKTSVNKINDYVVRVKLKNSSNKKLKHYAYYSGTEFFLNGYNIGVSAAYYLPARTEGRYLVFIDRYARQGAAVAFGAIGAAASTKTRASILDMESGIVREVDDEYMSVLLPETDYYEKYFEGKSDFDMLIEVVQHLNDELTNE